MSTENTQKQEEESKVERKFTAALDKLIAIVNGKENLKLNRKLPKNQVSKLVTDLFAEETEATYNSIKVSLKELLKQYTDMLKLVRQKEQELKKAENEKKEEFVKAATAIFDRIENIGDLEKSYYDSLRDLATTGNNQPVIAN